MHNKLEDTYQRENKPLPLFSPAIARPLHRLGESHEHKVVSRARKFVPNLELHTIPIFKMVSPTTPWVPSNKGITEEETGTVNDAGGVVDATYETPYMMGSAQIDIFNQELLISEQEQNARIGNIIQYLQQERFGQAAVEKRIALHAKRAYLSSDGLLWRYASTIDKLWEEKESFFRVLIPQTLVKTVIVLFHDDKLAGHAGRNKTHRRMEQWVFWHGMSRDVTNYIKACKKCTFSKPSLSHPAPCVAAGPGDVILVDLAYYKGANQ